MNPLFYIGRPPGSVASDRLFFFRYRHQGKIFHLVFKPSITPPEYPRRATNQLARHGLIKSPRRHGFYREHTLKRRGGWLLLEMWPPGQ